MRHIGMWVLGWTLSLALIAQAGESTIVVREGQACQIEDGKPSKSDKQIEDEARAITKREAAAEVATTIKSTIASDTLVVRDIANKTDNESVQKVGQHLHKAYVNADVKELETISKAWFADPHYGRCYSIRLKLEVTPKAEAMAGMSSFMLDDPTMPLTVRIWSDRSKGETKAIYRKGETMRFYLRGNKPFYARVIYTDANKQTVQVLPNPYRINNKFEGGPTYSVPTGGDLFTLEVAPPLGIEKVTVYASERPLGDLTLQPAGGVYVVEAGKGALSEQVRGIKLTPINDKDPKGGAISAEFSEHSVDIITTE
jgi:hypothetical protein